MAAKKSTEKSTVGKVGTAIKDAASVVAKAAEDHVIQPVGKALGLVDAPKGGKKTSPKKPAVAAKKTEVKKPEVKAAAKATKPVAKAAAKPAAKVAAKPAVPAKKTATAKLMSKSVAKTTAKPGAKKELPKPAAGRGPKKGR